MNAIFYKQSLSISLSRFATLRPLRATTASFLAGRQIQKPPTCLNPSQSTRRQISISLMTEPLTKRIKMSNGAGTAVIGTHNGHFHADEALAVYLLRLLPEYQSASLVRTRDPELLNTCSIVVDVGGVHDNELKRYDHHQREFVATFPEKGTKLSSAGLVWMHYGKDIISAVTGLDTASDDCALLYRKIYDNFVEAYDANDNGISVYDSSALRNAGVEPRFEDKGFSIASVVSRYNHLPSNGDLNASAKGKAATPEEEDSRFLRASKFVGEQFSIELDDKFHSWLPARAIVKKAFESRTQYDPQGRIIVIPYRQEGVPWSDHLYALEEEAGVKGSVLYALFAETGEPDSKWRIRAVSIDAGSFENRKSLPDQWKGVRDEELSRISGIPGCIFVHASGFIGGNATFEGALQMAQKAVEI